MIRFLIRTAVFFLAAAIGLLVASLVVSGMSINVTSFIFVVLIFAVIQALLAPLFTNMSERNAPALTGGVGLITTFLALLVTDLISDGLSIDGVSSWALATLIVWITTMIAAFVLPLLLIKKAVNERRD
jgi:uncharacterized membrane protein YvlD (DUF360 family)